MAPGTDLSFLAIEITATPETTLPQKTINTPSAASKGRVVLDPSQITRDYDKLRFEAAAFGQLQLPELEDHQASTPPHHSTSLISSPYNDPGHYLDLSDLDTADLIFAKALTALKPVRPDYATAPYTSSLNFPTILDLIRELAAAENFHWKSHSFYVVIFRSKLEECIDPELLYTLDYESHREACESGGLLKYWFGKPESERRNLATCKYYLSHLCGSV